MLEKSGCESDEYVYYWNVPHATYPIIVPLLDLEEYNYHLVKINLVDLSKLLLKLVEGTMC